MDRFKYEKFAPSIRVVRSRRTLSIVDKAILPVRAVVDPRSRNTRLVSANNNRFKESNSFIEGSGSKENIYLDNSRIKAGRLSLNSGPETQEKISAPLIVPLIQNKFLIEIDNMEEKLRVFYAGLT